MFHQMRTLSLLRQGNLLAQVSGVRFGTPDVVLKPWSAVNLPSRISQNVRVG